MTRDFSEPSTDGRGQGLSGSSGSFFGVEAQVTTAAWRRRLAELPHPRQAEVLTWPAGQAARELDRATMEGLP